MPHNMENNKLLKICDALSLSFLSSMAIPLVITASNPNEKINDIKGT